MPEPLNKGVNGVKFRHKSDVISLFELITAVTIKTYDFFV